MIKNIKAELYKALKMMVGQFEEIEKVYTESEIKISDKIVGGKVEMIQPDNTLAPAPDGDYKMEDGSMYSVKDGVITAIDGETPIVEEVPMEEVPVEDVPVENDKVTKLEERIISLEESIDKLYNMIEESKVSKEDEVSEFTKQVAELNQTIKTLASIPVEFTKVDSTVNVRESKDDKMNDLVKILNGRNK